MTKSPQWLDDFNKAFPDDFINKIICGDCLELMKEIDDKSIDLVCIDPPYNISIDKRWDKWKTVEKYVEFMGSVFLEIQRVLKDNGSLYFFHNDFLQIVELQNFLNKNTKFVFNSFITWDKGDFRALSWKNPNKNNNLRSWFNTCEYCLYYTFQDYSGLTTVMLDTNNFPTMRKYFKYLQEYIGVSKIEILKKVGQKADHCFRWKSTQWDMPTPETYQELIDKFNIDKWEGYKEYESLRQEYESLRYTHNLDTNHKNVWNYKKENMGKFHACQKPMSVIERIIRTSSNENDIVLDCFAGSGTTGVACKNLNRNYILIEKEPKYCEIARQRLRQEVLDFSTNSNKN